MEELKRALTELVSQRDAVEFEKRQAVQRELEQREVRFRVLGSTNTGTYTSRGDFMAFDYDYAAGTLVANEQPVAELATVGGTNTLLALAALADGDGEVHLAHMNGEPGSVATHLDRELMMGESPQASLERVEGARAIGGAQLTWAVAKGDHVDGFNVYREGADGALVFAGNDATFAIEGGDAVFRFTDAGGAEGASYWLGVRSCSGPEGLIGPIRVEAAAVASHLDLSAAPNPATNTTRFEFALAREADVTLEVFDLQGRKLATPLAVHLPAGPASAAWNLHASTGEAVGAGVYFARLQALGRTMYTRVTIAER